MSLYQVSAGDRILAADLNQFYSILKGVAASGEGITLIYNAAGSLILQPSSDPSAGTEILQIKNAASTVQSALSADGRLYAADGLVGTPGITFEQDKDTGLYRTGTNAGAWSAGGVIVSPLAIMVASGASHAAGFVPDPGASSGTSKFLREDATWAAASSSFISTATFFDDFMAGKMDNSGTQPINNIGGGAWTQKLAAGGISNFIAGLANHPGIAEFDTSATGSSAIAIYGPSTVFNAVLPADTFDMTWVLRPNSTVDANMEFRFGLRDDSTVSTSLAAPANGIYVEKLTGDTQYFGVTRAAASQTRTAAFATVTNGTWVKFRIRRVDASTIGFTLDANTEVNATATIPSVALQFFMEVGNHLTANSKKIDLDLFTIAVTSTR